MSREYMSLSYRLWKHRIAHRYSHIRGVVRTSKFLETIATIGLEKAKITESKSIFESDDWDNLIILDGCRSDTYNEVFGASDTRITLGSNSPEYIKNTYSSGDFSNLVYVTANPFFNEDHFQEFTGRSLEIFYEVFKVYETDWDEKLNTVPPLSVYKKMKLARRLFPEKKVIGHFMQPHYPFIDSNGLTKEGIDSNLKESFDERSVWDLSEMGEYRRGKVYEAYKSNLETLSDIINNSKSELDGETIVTADHGNFIGENGLYGHPPGSDAKVVREVPWDKL